MIKLNKTVSHSEEQIPKLAKAATKLAYRKVLASGNSVLVSKDGEIRRIFPDGSVKFVKKSVPPVKMRKGTIIKIT